LLLHWAPAGGAASFFLSPQEIITELKTKKNITESSLKLFTIVQLYLGVVKISTYLRLSINLTTQGYQILWLVKKLIV
jgi:hypothetical protein